MKIAITGDFHLGFNEDALQQAKNALDACRDADAIIIAGDIFDSRIPRQETLNEALQLFSQAAESLKSDATIYEMDADGVITGLPNYPPILAIAGTHERRSKGLANPIHLLDSALCAVNVHGRRICVQKKDEQVCFQAMAGVPEEFSRQVLKKMEFKPVKGAAFNVFIFHQSLAEAMPFGEALCSQDLPDGFDLYVDGHIHWMAELVEGKKRIFIPGSTVVTQMRKNEMRKKQVIIFDTRAGTYESRTFATRPFLYRDIVFENPVTSAEVVTQVDAALTEMLSPAHPQTPIVKLKLSGRLANGLESKDLDLSAITKRYADRVMLHIDRDFERNGSQQADAEELQKARSDPRGVREISVSLFVEALKRRDMEITPAQAEELLDALCEEDAARAIQLI